MEERQIKWSKIYLGLMVSLVAMIGLFYWLAVAFA
jgi:hypothetical protein